MGSAPDVPAIATYGLTKRFGRITAVKSLDLTVEQGLVFGFLGLNGAGKTTTIRLLLDLLRPSSGRAAILGHDCRTDGLAARALVGYLPGEIGLYRDMTGRQVLDFLSRLSRVPPGRPWQRAVPSRAARRKGREAPANPPRVASPPEEMASRTAANSAVPR